MELSPRQLKNFWVPLLVHQKYDHEKAKIARNRIMETPLKAAMFPGGNTAQICI